MKELRLEPIDGNDYKIYIEDEYIGRVDSPKWYSSARNITTADGIVYNLRSSAFLGFEFELRLEGKLLLEISSFRKSIFFKENGIIVYVIKREDYFYKPHVLLVDGKGNELIRMQSKFNWKEFDNNYTVKLSAGFGNTDLDKAMVILTKEFYYSLNEND